MNDHPDDTLDSPVEETTLDLSLVCGAYGPPGARCEREPRHRHYHRSMVGKSRARTLWMDWGWA
jgi:hypothetical protein